MEYVAIEVGVKPGYLYHTIDSLHTYQTVRGNEDFHPLNMEKSKESRWLSGIPL